jgi:nicotinamidase-related amidase
VRLVAFYNTKVMTYLLRKRSSHGSKNFCTRLERQGSQSTIPEKVRTSDTVHMWLLLISQGHRPDLSTLSSRERFRSKNNASGLGIGSEGPLGRLLVRGEPGHDIVPELYPIEDEPIIDKPGRGAFAHTDFELLLRIKGVKNLIIVGVTTDVCVSTTMREANDRGFDCLLLEDATSASEPNLHIGACESIKMEGGIFGATAKLNDVIEAVENFKQMTIRSGTKSERMPSSSMPQSPISPAPSTSQSITTPLPAAMRAQMPVSAVSAYASQSLNTEIQH